MKQNHDKIKGAVNSRIGDLKERVGRAMDDDDLEAEGYFQKKKGHAQKFSGALQELVQKGKDLLGIKR